MTDPTRSPISLALLVLGVLLSTGQASAQDPLEVQVVPPGQVQELVLTDGSVLYGRVVEEGDPFLFVLISGVESLIAVENVRSLRQAAGSVERGEFWPEDPNRTRLFFGPTARSLARGKDISPCTSFSYRSSRWLSRTASSSPGEHPSSSGQGTVVLSG